MSALRTHIYTGLMEGATVELVPAWESLYSQLEALPEPEVPSQLLGVWGWIQKQKFRASIDPSKSPVSVEILTIVDACTASINKLACGMCTHPCLCNVDLDKETHGLKLLVENLHRRMASTEAEHASSIFQQTVEALVCGSLARMFLEYGLAVDWLVAWVVDFFRLLRHILKDLRMETRCRIRDSIDSLLSRTLNLQIREALTSEQVNIVPALMGIHVTEYDAADAQRFAKLSGIVHEANSDDDDDNNNDDETLSEEEGKKNPKKKRKRGSRGKRTKTADHTALEGLFNERLSDWKPTAFAQAAIERDLSDMSLVKLKSWVSNRKTRLRSLSEN